MQVWPAQHASESQDIHAPTQVVGGGVGALVGAKEGGAGVGGGVGGAGVGGIPSTMLMSTQCA